jgi:hypothetical protein
MTLFYMHWYRYSVPSSSRMLWPAGTPASCFR